MKSLRLLAAAAAALAFHPGLAANAEDAGDAPRLAVVLVVDQLTADRTREWARKPSSHGFKRLWQGGVVYSNAAYDHATSSTAPGHATIATGVPPSRHGVISNYWFERELGRPLPSVWDRDYGVSPRRMAAPALADVLHAQHQGRSKIFAVSIKDRGAVFIAGEQGKSFWYSVGAGGFSSNAFYYPEGAEPEWLAGYNESWQRDVPKAWDLLMPAGAYQYEDDRSHERPPRGWTNAFPHAYAQPGTVGYFDQLRYAPDGDRITMGLAKLIIEEESLGQDGVPDLLSISLSATDRIGHAFGPNSREAEDNLHRLDLLLAEFLDYLENRLGREGFLLALSSDHGMRAIPEYAPGAALAATRVFSLRLTERLNRHLSARLNVEQKLLKAMVMPWLYFNESAIKRLELDPDSVYGIAGEWLEARPEIARTVPVSRLDDCMEDEICRLIRNVRFAGRSGDMYVVESRTSFVSADPPVYAASHGSPYRADLRVPVLFYGAGLRPEVVGRSVTPRHIAPTLAARLRLPRLDNWEEPLAEVAPQSR